MNKNRTIKTWFLSVALGVAFFAESNFAYGQAFPSCAAPPAFDANNYKICGNFFGTQIISRGNLRLGYQAGQSLTTGQNNTFLGIAAGRSNSTGGTNTFVGNNAGRENISTVNNTFIGANAGLNNKANSNTFVGTNSGRENTTGLNNSFTGLEAGRYNTTGSSNTFIGVRSGVTSVVGNQNTTGIQNTYIGQDAGPGTPTQLTNANAIGFNAHTMDNNQLILGNNLVNVGIGLSDDAILFGPQNKLEINYSVPNDYTAANTGGGTGFSGLRFRDLTANSTSQTTSNGKVLSVDGNGDVILVSGVGGDFSVGSYRPGMSSGCFIPGVTFPSDILIANNETQSVGIEDRLAHPTIISSQNSFVDPLIINSVILGGNCLQATLSNTVYTPDIIAEGNVSATASGATAVSGVVNGGGVTFESDGGSFKADGATGFNVGVFSEVGGSAGENYGGWFQSTTPGSGTNYGGYFNASSGTNNYALVTDNGNVGIGTLSPTAKMEINSGTGGTSGLRFTNLNAATGLINTGFITNKVLTVDNEGDVILVELPSSSTGFSTAKTADTESLASELESTKSELQSMKTQLAELQACVAALSNCNGKAGETQLNQNVPNPFDGKTLVSYSLAEKSNVELNVYSVQGVLITTLTKGEQNAGSYSVDCCPNNELAPGSYIYVLKANGVQLQKKAIVIK